MLTSDLRGNTDALKIILESGIVVLAHNIETIDRLTKFVRDGRATYKQTLQVLKNSKKIAPHIYTKSSIMLGLGEKEEEIIQTMKDLRTVDTDMLTLGQYLPPSESHIPLKEYIHPDQFKKLEKIGLDLGFIYVASGPLVRSSYKAGELFVKSLLKKMKNKV